jgi:asparaginyl-tRNA synthetase
MDLGEGLIRHVVNHVMRTCESDVALFDKFVEPDLLRHLRELADRKFVRVPYRDAVKILRESGRKFEYPAAFGADLQTEHERFLTEEHFHSPVTVYDYPRDIKAFYMRLNDDGETVAAMDLLVPRIGELIGGSQREERLEVLGKRIQENGQALEDYWWYLDLRRFGSAPHAGFGLGFERLVMLLTGVANIRDVLPFPRTPGSLEF